MPRPKREKLVEELGEDLVRWGEDMESVLPELPPDDETVKPDDKPSKRTVTPKLASAKCLVCGVAAADGRYCRRHKPGAKKKTAPKQP